MSAVGKAIMDIGPVKKNVHRKKIMKKIKTETDLMKKYHCRDDNGFISSTTFSPSKILKNFSINYHYLQRVHTSKAQLVQKVPYPQI